MPLAIDALMRIVRPNLAEPDRGLVERFVMAGDQAAFAELVDRHGPMVLGICRRLLRDPHRAEDAFQATFLVLARKAAKLRVESSLQSWLFGVARRVALAARRADDRQKRLTFRARSPVQSLNQQPGSDWDDLLQLLDAELARLPDKLRAPLLACYFDGRTQDEAARELGWSLSTLRRRLEQGRELLKVRLTAGGVALSAGLFAGAIAASAKAAVPQSLKQSATSIALHRETAPRIIVQLAHEGMGMSATVKWGIALSIIAVCAVAGTFGFNDGPSQPQEKKPATPQAAEVRRDQFNDPLPPRAIARMGTVGFRHPAVVSTLQYTPKSKGLVSVGPGAVIVWDAETGQERARLSGRSFRTDELINSAMLMNDDNTLLVDSFPPYAGNARTWQTYRWSLNAPSEKVEVLVQRVALAHSGGPSLFTADGSWMAEINDRGDVVVWSGDGKIRFDLENVALPRRYGRQPSAAFLESGKSVLTCNNSQLFQQWRTSTGKRIRSFGGQLPEPAAVAFSQDGKFVATISEKRVSGAALVGAAVPEKVRIWSVSTGKLVREIPWGEESRLAHRLFLTFGADSRCVIVLDEVAKESLEMRQWRVPDGKLVRHWTREDRNVYANAVAVSPDGKLLTIGSEFGYIRSFEIESGKEATPTNVHSGMIQALVFAENDKVLRTMAFDGTARDWDAANGRSLSNWRHDGTSPRLAPDGTTAIVSHVLDKSGRILLTARDPDSGIVRREFKGIRSFEFSDLGRTIWAKNETGDGITQWDLRSGNSLKSFANVPGTPIAITRAGSLVVLGNEERVIGFNADSGKKEFEWSLIEKKLVRANGSKPLDEIRAWAISPNGRQIAISVNLHSFRDPEDRDRIYLCELATGKVIWHFSLPDAAIQRVVFRPDGKTLAVAGGWTVALLDAATAKQLAELDGHRCSITALAFSADGKRLASGAMDGTALVWDVSDIKP